MKYRDFCAKTETLQLFNRSWWLDATCGEGNWEAVVINRGNEVVAALPFYRRRMSCFRLVTMPPLTQKFQLWVKYPSGQTTYTKLSYEKEICASVISQLPGTHYYHQNLYSEIVHWLPFIWGGYSQSIRYNYVIRNSDAVMVQKNFSHDIRNQINKARKLVEVKETEDIERFFAINKMTFSRQEMTIPYSLEFVSKLDEACRSRGCRKILIAVDEKGQCHCGIYLVWDKDNVYYIMSGGDPTLRNSGATSLVLFEGIVFAMESGRNFDFQGSMLEPIERFIRQFGAIPRTYFEFKKNASKVLSLGLTTRNVCNSYRLRFREAFVPGK